MNSDAELRLRRWDTAGLVALLCLGAATVVVFRFDSSPAVTGNAQLLFAVLGLVFAIRTARQPLLPAGIKRAWRIMLPMYALWVVTIPLYAVFAGQMFPSPPDVCRLLIAPATLIGILSFAQWPADRAERTKLRLDAALVGVGAAMVLWFLMVSPALARGGTTWHELVPGLVHPLFGAALLFGIGAVLLRGPGSTAARTPLLILVASTLLNLTADAIRAYSLNNGGPVLPTVLQTSLWTGAIYLHMLAPYVQCWYCRRTGESGYRPAYGSPGATPRWPYLTVIPGYALLMMAVGVRHPYPAGGLIAGAFAVSVLIILRQLVSAQETHRLAVTDGLTGLANRVRLYDELPRALGRAARDGSRVGVLILDMNGFKQVNDSLGHQAGDRLLAGFGDLLRRSVLGSDLVARLGGDEFAVVLPEIRDRDQIDAVVRRIRAAMAEPIDVGPTVVQPSASIGTALSEPGEPGADDLLARADLDMYDAKKAARR